MRGGRIERIEAHPDPEGRVFLRGQRDRINSDTTRLIQFSAKHGLVNWTSAKIVQP
jgi:hypothetical protein